MRIIYLKNQIHNDILSKSHEAWKQLSRACFISKVRGLYIVSDNTTGDMWTEEFKTKKEALEWAINGRRI